MKKFTIFLLVIATVAISAPTAVAAKKKTFKTGTYTATGDIAFKFTVRKAERAICASAGGPLVTINPLCFKSVSVPPISVPCPQEPNVDFVTPDPVRFVDEWNISRYGKVDATLEPLTQLADPVVVSKFKLALTKDGRATGSYSVTIDNSDDTVNPYVCRSGKMSFSAKRTSKKVK